VFAQPSGGIIRGANTIASLNHVVRVKNQVLQPQFRVTNNFFQIEIGGISIRGVINMKAKKRFC
jgi:hypothetical protein